MKTVFILFVMITNPQGYETLERVNQLDYQTKGQCEQVKRLHKNTDTKTFFCGSSDLFIKR